MEICIPGKCICRHFRHQHADDYGSVKSYSCHSVKFCFPLHFHRWWNLNVGALNLKAPHTVHPHVSIKETLELLDRENFDQVPVVDDSG